MVATGHFSLPTFLHSKPYVSDARLQRVTTRSAAVELLGGWLGRSEEGMLRSEVVP